VARTKIKTDAKNQNVRLTRFDPMIPSRKMYNPSTCHSQKFCLRSGTSLMCRIAVLASTISPSAVIQVTTIEFVIGRPNRWPISLAFWVRPLSSGPVLASRPAPCPDWLDLIAPLGDVVEVGLDFASCANTGPAPRPARMAAKSISAVGRFRLSSCRIMELHRDDNHLEKTTT